MLIVMKFQKLLLSCALLFSVIFSTAQEQAYFPDPNPAIQKRLEEWQDLKFGLLMHWGPYSQWGVVESWSICPEDVGWAVEGQKKGVANSYNEYVQKSEALKTTFNPSKFNPEAWASAAKEAGMKYMVFTTKHHDGFSMFDTKYTDYKITDKGTPFSSNPRSNIVKEVFQAFRSENFWIGAYFSKPDWHSDYYWWKKFPASDRNANYSIQKHPDQWKKFVDFTHNQIDELMTDYGKVDILWLDGGWVRKKTDEEVKAELLDVYDNSRWFRNPQSQDINMAEIVRKSRLKQPQLIVVDRAVPGEQQNYLTPEQHIPETGLPYPWETCMTMGNSWSYVPNDQYKSANELIEKLVDIVSKGGNYLLNIGPSPDGEFDTTAYERLKEIGSWIKINGEGIYGSRMNKSFNEGETIRFTKSKDGKTQYVFLFDYPKDGIVDISKIDIPEKSKMTLLGSTKNLKWKRTANGVQIQVPASMLSASEHVWTIKISQ
jgi:alpha-L-fucosidase